MKSSIAVLCVDSKRQVELNIFQNLQSIFHKCEMKEEKARLLVYLRTEKNKKKPYVLLSLAVTLH